ncbi:hypothetical protein BDV25DRAFT_142711 [Aspergillus avenaceus]|uniref:Uncharacterized protein n=1 Tax=Aspergillus avenaceus TaxID=36643 RepID=A0A5N6TM82_ASPAV|nr:hypothetical protein BDV25DRAFT_142711 [Aspergillus avenaceus]
MMRLTPEPPEGLMTEISPSLPHEELSCWWCFFTQPKTPVASAPPSPTQYRTGPTTAYMQTTVAAPTKALSTDDFQLDTSPVIISIRPQTTPFPPQPTSLITAITTTPPVSPETLKTTTTTQRTTTPTTTPHQTTIKTTASPSTPQPTLQPQTDHPNPTAQETTATSTPTPASNPTTLSPATKLAIALPITLIGLTTLATLFYLLLRRRRTAQKSTPTTPQSHATILPKPPPLWDFSRPSPETPTFHPNTLPVPQTTTLQTIYPHSPVLSRFTEQVDDDDETITPSPPLTARHTDAEYPPGPNWPLSPFDDPRDDVVSVISFSERRRTARVPESEVSSISSVASFEEFVRQAPLRF